MSSTYIDLHNLSEITVDAIDVSNLNCDSIITTDLTVSGDLLGLIASSSSIFNYTYTPSTRTFTLGLANQAGIDYILITDGSGVFQVVLFTPLIYPLLSATAPIIYNNTTGVFSLDTTIVQNETFTGLLTATADPSSTVSQANAVYVVPTSTNTNYFIPLIPSITTGYKNFVVDSNTTFFYNPVTDQLTSNNFTGASTVKTNSYQGLTTSSVITIGNALNTITIAGTTTVSLGLNIPTGQTYKINSVPIDTDDIPSVGATNKYLNSLTATSPILYNSGTYVVSFDTTANIIFTGNISTTTGFDISLGQTYKINSVPIVLLSSLTTTPTTTITHTFVSPNLQSNINALSISDSLITNNTISLSKINAGAYNQFGTSSVLAQFNSNGGLNPTYIANISGNTITNFLYSPGTSSTSLGSVIPTLVIGEQFVNSGVIRLDSLDANKGYIHQLSNDMYIETTNSVGSTINIGKGTNTNTTIRNLTVTSNIGCNAMTVTNTSTADQMAGTGGVSNFTPSGATPGVVCGTDFVADGVLRLSSSTAGSGSVIQQIFQDTYIDNMTANRSVNIGTNLLTTTNISGTTGRTVFNGSIEYGGGIRFTNIRKISISPMQHTTSLPFVTGNWLPIGNTATTVVLEANITMRSAYSAVRITVNIPLTNWSATASNAHLTVCRNTSAAAWGVLQTTPLLGNNYGMYHHLNGGPLFETVNFTWIDTTALTRGSTYYYSLCGRGNTAIIAGLNVGNNNYSEITLEELY